MGLKGAVSDVSVRRDIPGENYKMVYKLSGVTEELAKLISIHIDHMLLEKFSDVDHVLKSWSENW